MEVLANSAIVAVSTLFSFKFYKSPTQIPSTNFRPHNFLRKNYPFDLSSNFRTRTCATSSSTAETPSSLSSSSSVSDNRHWMVLMEAPPQGIASKPEIIDYYVKTLGRVLGSERDAQMCIYDASSDTHFGFCCDIDEETSSELACLPEVLSVRPDPDFNSVEKDYSASNVQTGYLSNPKNGSTLLFPSRNTKYWVVLMDNPYIGAVSKAQMVDYYVQILAKVLGNEKDAQMCIYHISWQSNFGFCCELDDKCAKELSGVPGVLTVQPDENIESEIKDYRGEIIKNSVDQSSSLEANQTTPIKTKKLFVTGLSFYTSEKTLRAAFEGFGEIVEVKIIMDKISKRSKGYAFVEYTTEEAASAALKEMNGKIINGWMIVVDVAKTTPPRSSRGRPRQSV